MVLNEDTRQVAKGYQSIVHKGRIERDSRRQEDGDLPEAYAVIPHMESTLALRFTKDTVRRPSEVMRGLEDVWNALGHGNRKYKEV